MRGDGWRDQVRSARGALEEEPPAAGDRAAHVAWLGRQARAAEAVLAGTAPGDEDHALAEDVLFEARDELRRLGGAT